VAADIEHMRDEVARGEQDWRAALELAIEIGDGCEQGAETVHGGEIWQIDQDVDPAGVVERADFAGNLRAEEETHGAVQAKWKVFARGGEELG
jgi:hypothetical protein